MSKYAGRNQTPGRWSALRRPSCRPRINGAPIIRNGHVRFPSFRKTRPLDGTSSGINDRRIGRQKFGEGGTHGIQRAVSVVGITERLQFRPNSKTQIPPTGRSMTHRNRIETNERPVFGSEEEFPSTCLPFHWACPTRSSAFRIPHTLPAIGHGIDKGRPSRCGSRARWGHRAVPSFRTRERVKVPSKAPTARMSPCGLRAAQKDEKKRWRRAG